MRSIRRLAILAAWAALVLAWPCPPAQAVELRAEDLTPIALRASLDRVVPVLDLPVSGVRFLLVWKAHGQTRVAELTSRQGRHSYEMRHLPGWSGVAEFVALSTFRGQPGSLGRLDRPDPAAEWDMLTARRQYLPIVVNRLDPQGFLGLPENLLLLGLGGAAALALWLARPRRERLAWALAGGMVLALAAGDLRQLPARILLPADLDANQQVQTARGYAAWLDSLKPAMGDRAWDMEALPYPLDLHARYLLAERPYRPGLSGEVVVTLREGQPAVYLRP
jgi:hypothetical protein